MVEKMLSLVNYLLRRLSRNKPFVSHVDKLRKCFETESEPVLPSAAPRPAVSSLPPSAGREYLQSLLAACDGSYGSDKERVARPKKQTRAPKRFIEQY